ncbi:hypothetical protein ACFPVT_04975 [Corynebacterium choanae]|uniref:hypothetical protein n=1 Tax=Corynebacterium choanae TaxID=1862358 RepID=UPI0013DDE53A|nr:hypothetical protein [Corynebacterium choanae]
MNVSIMPVVNHVSLSLATIAMVRAIPDINTLNLSPSAAQWYSSVVAALIAQGGTLQQSWDTGFFDAAGVRLRRCFLLCTVFCAPHNHACLRILQAAGFVGTP